jgi:inorganic pyrophosphatase/exopolyphosphatase
MPRGKNRAERPDLTCYVCIVKPTGFQETQTDRKIYLNVYMQPASVVATADCAACASAIVTAHMKKEICYASCAREVWHGKSMKRHIKKLKCMKKITFIIAIASLGTFLLPAHNAYASGSSKKNKTAVTHQSVLTAQYVTNNEEGTVLRLMVNHPTGQTATLRISDAYGEVLYTERFSGKNYEKMIRIDHNEIDRLVLVLTTAEGSLRKEYQLNVQQVSVPVLEEVTIK